MSTSATDQGQGEDGHAWRSRNVRKENNKKHFTEEDGLKNRSFLFCHDKLLPASQYIRMQVFEKKNNKK